MAGYQLRSEFELGYRNKEDISTLPPEVLVVGSQNVLTNAAEQVGIRQGYVLDGAAGNENDYGIDSAYDFGSQSGTKNLRKWGSTIEVRYVNPVSEVVSWVALLSSLVATNPVRFTDFWDYNTEKKEQCLFVNGNNIIYEWSGGVASVASVSNASGIIGAITVQPNTTDNTSGGAGYVVGDVLTITGGDGTATLKVLSVSHGGIATASVGALGTSYVVNDIVAVLVSGGQAAIIKITSVNGGGGVTGFSILTAGIGYIAGTTHATTGGTGSGLTIAVNTIGDTVSSWILETNGSGYSPATNVPTTGGSGTGATVEILSVGTNSITVSGTKSLSELGFYDNANNSGKFQLLIDGVTYTYTATNGNGGMTFSGISPDPTLAIINPGDAVIQVVSSKTAEGISSLPTDFNFDLISTLINQVYYGDETNNTFYISKVNDYTSVAASNPRLPGEGALATLDSPPIGFKPQTNQSTTNSNTMYVAAGANQWYAVSFVLSSDLTNESIQITRLKTTPLQGAQSQELIADFKNTIAFISNEPILNEFGIQANYFSEPQMQNISDPIKYDMDAYDFLGGQVFYWNYYLFFTVPKMGVVRMYNVVKKYWEAPQTLPISRFYLVDDQLYGHSSLTNESYQLFTGYNDNGNPINAVAAFPYIATIPKIAEPDDLKSFDRIYTEGYIAGNTQLLLTINYDFGGFSGSYDVAIEGQPAFGGNPNPIIFNRVTDGSLGQNTLGTQPIGTILNLGAQPNNPKFRVINTMPKHDFFESQIVYSSNDVDQQWTLLRFGPLVQRSKNLPSFITL